MIQKLSTRGVVASKKRMAGMSAIVAVAALSLSVVTATPASAANPIATVMVQTQRMSAATLQSTQNGWYAKGSKISLSCYARGQGVKGYFSPNAYDYIWYRVSDGYWVADVDIETGSNNPVTAACDAPPVNTDRTVAVNNDAPGNVRDAPTTTGKLLYQIPNHQNVTISCFVHGQPWSGGHYKLNNYDIWNKIAGQNAYIWDGALETGSNNPIVPSCGSTPPPPPPPPSPKGLTAATAQCPDLIVLGARGSGEEMSSGSITGFGPEVSAAAKNMIPRVQRSGTYRYASIPYEASPVPQRIDRYKPSVTEGAAMAASILNSLSKNCVNRSKFALLGYSQGADLWRRAMPQLSAAARANVIVVGLIADPKRRGFDQSPSELGYHETFDSGTLYGSGMLLAGGQFSNWLANANTKVATFCVKEDPVCNFPANSSFRWSYFSGDTHAHYYQGSGPVEKIGFGLYTRLVSNGFR